MVNLIRFPGTRLYIEEPAFSAGAGPGLAFYSDSDRPGTVPLARLAQARGIFAVFCPFAGPAEEAWTALADGLRATLAKLAAGELAFCWTDADSIGNVTSFVRGDVQSRKLKGELRHAA